MASKSDKQITRTTAIGAAQRMLCIARKRLGQKAFCCGLCIFILIKKTSPIYKEHDEKYMQECITNLREKNIEI